MAHLQVRVIRATNHQPQPRERKRRLRPLPFCRTSRSPPRSLAVHLSTCLSFPISLFIRSALRRKDVVCGG
jgi:hypothetical protein